MSSRNPYESPAIPEEEPSLAKLRSSEDEYPPIPFKSPYWIGKIAILFFVLFVLLTTFGAYAHVRLYLLDNESIPEEEVDVIAVEELRYWLGILPTASLPLVLIANAWLIAFMFRCHRNLESLDHRELDSKHIWVIICWFVPVLNLFCPFQVMREIWWRSHPHAGISLSSPTSSHVVFGWWLTKLAAIVLGYLAVSFSNYTTWPQYYTFLRTVLLACGFNLATVLLGIFIIYRVSQWQIARYRLLQQSTAASS
jgi:hypothetical protein